MISPAMGFEQSYGTRNNIPSYKTGLKSKQFSHNSHTTVACEAGLNPIRKKLVAP